MNPYDFVTLKLRISLKDPMFYSKTEKLGKKFQQQTFKIVADL